MLRKGANRELRHTATPRPDWRSGLPTNYFKLSSVLIGEWFRADSPGQTAFRSLARSAQTAPLYALERRNAATRFH